MELLEIFWRLMVDFGTLIVALLGLALRWSLLLAWVAWWLWGVNWTKAWPVLARGAWVPLVLLMVLAALAWSRLSPEPCTCLGFSVPNFWWQLGGVGLLAAVTFFCGWLQGVFGWEPAEVNLEPPAHAGPQHAHH